MRLQAMTGRMIVVVGVLFLAGCARADGELIRLCGEIVPALEASEVKLRLGLAQALSTDGKRVRIPFTAIDPNGNQRSRFVSCAYEGGGALAQTGPRLIAIETDQGPFNDAQLHFLLRFWVNAEESVAEGRTRFIADDSQTPQWLAYFIQALVNAAPWTAILTLLATAYSLLYGLSHRINLAFGDLAVIGSYAMVASLSAALAFGGISAAFLALGLAVAIVTSGLAARALTSIVISPLVDQPGRMLLVATIGVELAIQEGLRIAQGPNNQWIRPILATPHILFTGGGFPVHVTTMQVVVAVLSLTLAGLALAIMRWSRFGLSWRALADDRLAAALCGVSPTRILQQAMLGAGVLAGVCGAVITLAYGNAHYSLGTVLGLKAIIAAILGGIGSVAGALIGGIALGLFEGMWSAYLSIETRDIAVYALLSLVLVVRPGGILGLSADRREV